MCYFRIACVSLLLLSATIFAQQSSTPPASSGENPSASSSQATTVRGCLRGQRNNYILIEDKTGNVYVLKGVGNKLDKYRRHEVEVTGRALSGTVKTGIRPEKEGSNPSDTAHGVDGVPFQVDNPQSDVREVAKRCKAADQD
jgi:hypothetical protein